MVSPVVVTTSNAQSDPMKLLQSAAVAGLLCLPLGYAVAPASAATAHNSQAGANGSTTNAEKPIHKHMMKKHMKKM